MPDPHFSQPRSLEADVKEALVAKEAADKLLADKVITEPLYCLIIEAIRRWLASPYGLM